ncbi:class I SAM-dependent methyltransferase [Hymenobacter coalescens]
MSHHAVTIEAYNQLAESYEAKFMDWDLYDATYDAFCALLPGAQPQLLEVGCGPGNVTRQLLARRPDARLLATDAAPNMVARAQANNPAARCAVLDARQLGTLPGPYDGIVSGFCLPYLAADDCAQFIGQCHRLLRAGGALYVSLIEGDEAQSGYQASSDGQHRAYLHYYPADFVPRLLTSHGLTLHSLTRVSRPQPHGPTATDLVYLALKPADKPAAGALNSPAVSGR